MVGELAALDRRERQLLDRAGLPAFNPGFRHQGQPVVISEVGLWRIDGYPPLGPWEEYGSTKVPTEDAYLDLYCDVIVGLMSEPDCAGFSYVQLYDVEGEVNGYLTYDRRPKVPPEVIRSIHAYGLGRHWANRETRLCSTGTGRGPPVAKVQTLVPQAKMRPQSVAVYYRRPRQRLDGETISTTADGNRDRAGLGPTSRPAPLSAPCGTIPTSGSASRLTWPNFRGSAKRRRLFLELHHDEDAEIYINGKQVKSVEGFVTRYLQLPLDAAAVKTLRRAEIRSRSTATIRPAANTLTLE